ncbi:MAG: RNA-binding protein, partial [Pseudomonadota bacterium]
MNIYVGNLPYNCDDNALRELFGQAGQVAQAKVITDRYSGASRGFGFVEMPSSEEGQAAISRFNGFNMGGRNLTVNEAKPREGGGGGGGGRGPGGGGGRGPGGGG